MYSKYGFTYVFFIGWVFAGTVWFAQDGKCAVRVTVVLF
jgi:hypothetical protein